MKVNYPETILCKSKGTTQSEEYLSRLCENTFLSLWSFPNIYRDQGRTKNKSGEYIGNGKEVCDLLVVFENHVFIFSDKYCNFPDSGDIKKDWCRWYKRTVENSAKQIYGAERWMFNVEGDIYIDSKCTQYFPYDIPPRKDAIIHRIIVAHGSRDACEKHFDGGSGSLMLHSDIIDEIHTNCENPFWRPFAIGQVNQAKGFVHVLDDVTLEIVMKTLDTISDLSEYLLKKENFFGSDKHILATGEEDLLAHYLYNFDAKGQHAFITKESKSASIMVISEGAWDSYCKSETRRTQIKENEISYSWDKMIDKFASNLFKGTSRFLSHPSIKEQENVLRFLARENRTRRRYLSISIHEMIKKTPEDGRLVRRFISKHSKGTLYVFLVLGKPEDLEYELYRNTRQQMLQAYCGIGKLNHQNAKDIIGIATEAGLPKERSEDFVYIDARNWSEKDREWALEQKEILEAVGSKPEKSIFVSTEREYPKLGEKFGTKLKGRDRNKPCPCGSEKKIKNCCGKDI